MANPSTEPDRGEPSVSSSSPFDGDDPPSWKEDAEMSMPDGVSSSFAKEMARSWVQRHQKATMLGAFAVGVFVGTMLRD